MKHFYISIYPDQGHAGFGDNTRNTEWNASTLQINTAFYSWTFHQHNTVNSSWH